MTHTADVGLIFATLSSLLYIALGAWVLTLTPRRRQTKLLGAFAILFGLAWAQGYLQILFDLASPDAARLDVLFGLLGPFFNLAGLGLAVSVPRRLEDRRVLGLALVVGFGFSTVYAVSGVLVTPLEGALQAFLGADRFLGSGLFWSAVALLALRAHPSQGLTRDETVQLAVLAVGFGFFWDLVSGGNVPQVAADLARGELLGATDDAAILGAWLTFAALWGRNMLAADDDTVRIHRTVMVAILALLLGGALMFTFLVPGVLGNQVVGSIARTLAVGVLAYGVLRHDLAGLDEKVEFGVSKTTVAGIFVAVFFVVSEGAQALFADFAGNEFLGVGAAGLLVFFLAPLQRFADRFAAKAVPGGAQAGAGAEERYRREVEMALADGRISRDEERRLGRRAAELGIDADRATEIRGQVEDERAGRGEAS